MEMVEMVLLENGFRQAELDNGKEGWTRQNLCAGGVFDLDIWQADDTDRAAYVTQASKRGMTELSELLVKQPSDFRWACRLYGGKDADITQVRTEDGLMTMVVQFLKG
jgi:hypothetical protein